MNNIIFNDGNIFDKSEVSSTPSIIIIPHSKLQKDAACLPNSVEVARNNSEVAIIEGLVIVIPSNPETHLGGIIKHAWNVVDNVQFDVTEEIIWKEDYKQLFYYPIIKKEESEYGMGLIDFDKKIYEYKEELEKQLEDAKAAKKKLDDNNLKELEK